MGKTAKQPRADRGPSTPAHRMARLRAQREKLTDKLRRLDAQLDRLAETTDRGGRTRSTADLDQWLDALSEGLPSIPPLPTDFARQHIYDDHD